MRHIETHKHPEDKNAENVTVIAEEKLGPGGAPHFYMITGTDESCHIHFQNGPINEAGPNGITMEALLAVVKDRLEHFQRGPYPCEENARALVSVNIALAALHERTGRRITKGIEGYSK